MANSNSWLTRTRTLALTLTLTLAFTLTPNPDPSPNSNQAKLLKAAATLADLETDIAKSRWTAVLQARLGYG